MMRHFISILLLGHACAQELPRRQDDTIPSQVDQMYERGLRFLASKQNDEGCWDDSNCRRTQVLSTDK